jgi:hypothetical protein
MRAARKREHISGEERGLVEVCDGGCFTVI